LVEVGPEREKKNLIPNSVHTRRGQENSERNIKKIQKIIKTLPGINFSQNWLRLAQKERKKFYS